ncbi:TPA: hypothetical protein N0F65_007255 [Lagenidium giganteum]|uniref:Uncharacterized protein n=1 Tax=Lagenidium giganteum TaxID=4803 RepID=A0AAV2YWW9_9STRA|nr:TPA: hypothetical protein N0F65_007255 [Lagenidium giganteum]
MYLDLDGYEQYLEDMKRQSEQRPASAHPASRLATPRSADDTPHQEQLFLQTSTPTPPATAKPSRPQSARPRLTGNGRSASATDTGPATTVPRAPAPLTAGRSTVGIRRKRQSEGGGVNARIRAVYHDVGRSGGSVGVSMAPLSSVTAAATIASRFKVFQQSELHDEYFKLVDVVTELRAAVQQEQAKKTKAMARVRRLEEITALKDKKIEALLQTRSSLTSCGGGGSLDHHGSLLTSTASAVASQRELAQKDRQYHTMVQKLRYKIAQQTQLLASYEEAMQALRAGIKSTNLMELEEERNQLYVELRNKDRRLGMQHVEIETARRRVNELMQLDATYKQQLAKLQQDLKRAVLEKQKLEQETQVMQGWVDQLQGKLTLEQRKRTYDQQVAQHVGNTMMGTSPTRAAVLAAALDEMKNSLKKERPSAATTPKRTPRDRPRQEAAATAVASPRSQAQVTPTQPSARPTSAGRTRPTTAAATASTTATPKSPARTPAPKGKNAGARAGAESAADRVKDSSKHVDDTEDLEAESRTETDEDISGPEAGTLAAALAELETLRDQVQQNQEQQQHLRDAEAQEDKDNEDVQVDSDTELQEDTTKQDMPPTHTIQPPKQIAPEPVPATAPAQTPVFECEHKSAQPPPKPTSTTVPTVPVSTPKPPERPEPVKPRMSSSSLAYMANYGTEPFDESEPDDDDRSERGSSIEAQRVRELLFGNNNSNSSGSGTVSNSEVAPTSAVGELTTATHDAIAAVVDDDERERVTQRLQVEEAQQILRELDELDLASSESSDELTRPTAEDEPRTTTTPNAVPITAPTPTPAPVIPVPAPAAPAPVMTQDEGDVATAVAAVTTAVVPPQLSRSSTGSSYTSYSNSSSGSSRSSGTSSSYSSSSASSQTNSSTSLQGTEDDDDNDSSGPGMRMMALVDAARASMTMDKAEAAATVAALAAAPTADEDPEAAYDSDFTETTDQS